MTQVGLLLSLTALATILFEVPTGAIADIYGRKVSVVIGFLLSAFFMLLIPSSNLFIIIAAFWFLMSVANTFSSGAGEAWMVDYLKKNRKYSLMTTALARRHVFIYAGITSSFLISGLIVSKYSMTWLWYIAAAVLITLSVFLIVFGKEDFRGKKPKSIRGLFGQNLRVSIEGVNYSRKHPILKFLMVATFLTAIVSMMNIVWPPFMSELGIPLMYVGPAYALYSLVGVIVPNFSSPIMRRFGGERKALVAITTLILFSSLALAFSPNWQVFIALWFISAMTDVLYAPTSISFFQRYAKSNIRATLGSLREMAFGIGGVFAPVIAGFVADTYGLRAVIILAAAFVLPIIAIYIKVNEGQENSHITKE
jgi:MFS family permease